MKKKILLLTLAANMAAMQIVLPAEAANSVSGITSNISALLGSGDLGINDVLNKSSDEDEEENTLEQGSAQTVAEADMEEVHVKTQEDLDKVAKKCQSDVWSRDKKILIDADLELSGDSDVIIPIFGGILDGQGHTISGLTVTENVSKAGLIRVVQKSGVVRNLTVEGTITPGGTQNKCGGIAGVNYGTISGCVFSGAVRADAQAGGIVGRNMQCGVVTNCTSEGKIRTSSYSGGIAGYNEGTISSCVNAAKVNTEYEDETISTDQITNTVNNIITTGNIMSLENIYTNTDIGGIAGFSSGVVSSCQNTAQIGYEHVGYNVGGIVGRSSGYVSSCTNKGKINGRKDIGGVVGQLQPYLQLDFSDDKIQELEDKIDKLQASVKNATNNLQSRTDTSGTYLDRIGDLATTASDSIGTLKEETVSDIDEATDRINDAAGKITGSLNELSSASKEASGYASDLKSAMSDLDDELDDFLDDLELSDDEKDGITDSLHDMHTHLDTLTSNIESFRKDLQDYADGKTDDAQQLASDLKQLDDNLTDVMDDIQGILDKLAAHPEITPDLKEMAFYKTLKRAKELITNLKNAAVKWKSIIDVIHAGHNTVTTWKLNDLNDLISALRDPTQSNKEKIDAIKSEILRKMDEDQDPDFTDEQREAIKKQLQDLSDSNGEIGDALNSLETLYKDLAENPDAIKDDADDLRNNLNKISSSLNDESSSASSLLQSMEDAAGDLFDADDSDLSDALDSLRDTAKNYPNVLDKIGNALDTLASIDLTVDGLSDKARTAGDDLYSSLDGMINEANDLHKQVAGDLDDSYDDLRDITNQLDSVTDTLTDTVDDIKDNVTKDKDDRFQDISAEDIDNSTLGRVTGSVNEGSIDADTNVGGIVGMIGVEYGLDPEEDIVQSGDETLDYVFKSKGIVDRCTNKGDVTTRSNYAAGITGHMELGVLSQNINYGDVDGGGDYAGGVCGYSNGTIQKCSAKADISGGDYVGGIVGFGKKLYSNASMANITEYQKGAGAVAGGVRDLKTDYVKDNLYYSTDLAGIDDIAYDGAAEYVSLGDIVSKGGVPANFANLTLRFVADDNTVKTITCSYGDTISDSRIPEVPEKDGLYGRWSLTDFSRIKTDEKITAVYKRVETGIQSTNRRESGRPVLIVDGSFAQDDQLKIYEDQHDGGVIEQWNIVIPDDGQEEHQIRYLQPDDVQNVKITVTDEKGTHRAKLTSYGYYNLFKAKGSNVTISVREVPVVSRKKKIAIAVVAGAAALALIVHVALMVARRRRRRPKPADHKD